MKDLVKLGVVGASLVTVGLLGLAACVSTVLPQSARRSDLVITSMIQASLQANDTMKAQPLEIETREGIVYLTGVVDTEEHRREAGRVVWSTLDVDRVMNELTVGERTVGRLDGVTAGDPGGVLIGW